MLDDLFCIVVGTVIFKCRQFSAFTADMRSSSVGPDFIAVEKTISQNFDAISLGGWLYYIARFLGVYFFAKSDLISCHYAFCDIYGENVRVRIV